MDWLESGYDEHMRAVKGAQHQQKLSEAEQKVAAELRAKHGNELAMVSSPQQRHSVLHSLYKHC